VGHHRPSLRGSADHPEGVGCHYASGIESMSDENASDDKQTSDDEQAPEEFDGFTVQGMETTLAILASLVAHRSDLDMLVPPQTSGEGEKAKAAAPVLTEAEMSNAEFQAALMSL